MTRKRATITEADEGRVQFRLGDEFTNRRETVSVHEREYPNFTARLAIKLIEHFGVVAAKNAGEDSSGRQAMALQNPAELVERAVTIAELATAKLRERGHMLTMPALTDLSDDD